MSKYRPGDVVKLMNGVTKTVHLIDKYGGVFSEDGELLSIRSMVRASRTSYKYTIGEVPGSKGLVSIVALKNGVVNPYRTQDGMWRTELGVAKLVTEKIHQTVTAHISDSEFKWEKPNYGYGYYNEGYTVFTEPESYIDNQPFRRKKRSFPTFEKVKTTL